MAILSINPITGKFKRLRLRQVLTDLVNPLLDHEFCGKFSAAGKHQSIPGNPEIILPRAGALPGETESRELLLKGSNNQVAICLLLAGQTGKDGLPLSVGEGEFIVPIGFLADDKGAHRLLGFGKAQS